MSKSFSLPPLSDYPSRKEWENACWRKILNSEELLQLLVAPYERHSLIMRAAVIDRVNSGKSYKQIGEELFVSPQTISSIKKAVNENRYRSYRERGKTERKKKKYSSGLVFGKDNRHPGKPIRTKYGTIHIPNY